MAINPLEVATVGYNMLKVLNHWWTTQRPIRRLLSGIADNERLTRIFIRDFVIPPDVPLLSQDRGGTCQVSNVVDLWARVEGMALANVLNVMGQVAKTRRIEVVEMSKDTGLWDSDLIVLGAQAQKCFDFYQHMRNVAYSMDNANIIDAKGLIVQRQAGYGYGIILKCENPFVHSGIGFLIGGYGTLGTEAAGYYFMKHCADLGKIFGKKFFGIVVSASVTAGANSAQRIGSLDVVF